MTRLYPRKQTFLIFIICIIAVAGALYYSRGNSSSQKTPDNSALTAKKSDAEIAGGLDSNTDWKKQFFDTSSTSKPYNPTSKSLSSSIKNEPLTATDILGRNFFTTYMKLRQGGLTNDSQAITEAANQVISESMSGVAEPKRYSVENIKVIRADTLELSRAYAEKLMAILKSWMPAKNEAEVAMNAFEKDDMALLKGIDPIISGYKSTLSNLIALPVPTNLAQFHLSLVNGISMQISNAESLRKSDTDPVSGLAAIGQELKSLETIANAISGMQIYFDSVGIVFTLPSSGSILQSR